MIARTLTLFLLVCLPLAVSAQPTAFTYQGYLTESGSAADGSYDFELALYTVDTGGTAIDVNAFDDVTVTGGLFSLPADFTGAPFEAGGDYWVEARVCDGADTGAFTPLLPRQPVNASPYAIAAQAVIAPLDVAGDAAVQGELNVGGDITTTNEVRAGRLEADEIWTDGPADFLGGALIQRGGDNVALLVQNDGPTQPTVRVVGKLEVGNLSCGGGDGCVGADTLGPGVYVDRSDLVEVSNTVNVAAGQENSSDAFCPDEDHLPVFGDCPASLGLELLGMNYLNLSNPALSAGIRCTARNSSAAVSRLVVARVFCVPPGTP